MPIPEYEATNVHGKEQWNISLGVRNKDKERIKEIQGALDRSQGEINKILDEYGVPHFAIVDGDTLEKKAREAQGMKVDKPI